MAASSVFPELGAASPSMATMQLGLHAAYSLIRCFDDDGAGTN